MTKKTYNNIEDFLNDTSFKNWALESRLSDVSFWEFWLKNNPSKRDMAMEAKDILIGISFKSNVLSDQKIEADWSKLEARLKTSKKQKPVAQIRERKSKKRFRYGIVASFLLLISVALASYFSDDRIVHKTSYGEILELKLKDGSLVTLNSNSSISYRDGDYRKVTLKGEAYFKVDKKETTNAKFWVKTKDLTVEVYGTEFNVNTQRNKTKIYLEEGNIWLNLNNGESKRMLPGNYIEYSSDKKKILLEEKKASHLEQAAWKNGNLVFHNFTLEEALEKVSDTYGVEFTYKSLETKNILITGMVPTTNLDICLNAIKKSANITIKKENSKLVVYKTN